MSQLSTIVGTATGSPAAWLDILRWTAPLILAGLSFAIAARSGLFNIGIEGQIYAGGFLAVLVGIHSPLPGPVTVCLAIAAGFVGGALIAWPAEFLRRRFGVNEIVSTLMLNYICVLLTEWLTKEYFQGTVGGIVGSVVATESINPDARLPALSMVSDANAGIFIAIIIAIVLAVLMSRGRSGYSLRAISASSKFAQFAGVDVDSTRRTAFLVSGGLAGLVGAIEVLGVQQRFVVGFAGQLGIEAILIAVVGAYLPLGVLVAALLFGVIRNVGLTMSQITDVSSYLITLVTAVFMIIFLADPVKKLLSSLRRRPSA